MDTKKEIHIIDITFFLYQLLIVFVILLFNDKIPNSKNLLIVHIIFFIVQFIFINIIPKNNLLCFIRFAYPLLCISFFYIETSYLNKLVFKNFFDNTLFNIDNLIFGFHPSLVFCKKFDFLILKEFLALGYLYYYLIIPCTGLYILFKIGKNIFKEYIFVIFFSFIIYYIIFIIFPSAGPHYIFKNYFNESFNGIFFTKIVRYLEFNIEVPTGAFPSSHIGICLISLIYLFKYLIEEKNYSMPEFAELKNMDNQKFLSNNSEEKILRLIFIIINCILFLFLSLATIYIGAHYFIDIPFGFLTGYLFLKLNKYIYSKLYQ